MLVRIKVIGDFTFLHQGRITQYKWELGGERELQTSQLLALKQSFCNMEQGWGMRNTHILPLPGRYHSPRLGLERSVFVPIPKKGSAKECSNYHAIVLISHASKVMEKAMATHSYKSLANPMDGGAW